MKRFTLMAGLVLMLCCFQSSEADAGILGRLKCRRPLQVLRRRKAHKCFPLIGRRRARLCPPVPLSPTCPPAAHPAPMPRPCPTCPAPSATINYQPGAVINGPVSNGPAEVYPFTLPKSDYIPPSPGQDDSAGDVGLSGGHDHGALSDDGADDDAGVYVIDYTDVSE